MVYVRRRGTVQLDGELDNDTPTPGIKAIVRSPFYYRAKFHKAVKQKILLSNFSNFIKQKILLSKPLVGH